MNRPQMHSISPKCLCNMHLIQEHSDLHAIHKLFSTEPEAIDNLIKNKRVNILKMEERHNELVKEIETRGFTHTDPLSLLGIIIEGKAVEELNIDLDYCLVECGECNEKMIKATAKGLVKYLTQLEVSEEDKDKVREKIDALVTLFRIKKETT